MKVAATQSGNILTVCCKEPRVVTILSQALRYRKKKFLATYAERKEHEGRHVIFLPVACYEPVRIDGTLYYRTLSGFRQLIEETLSKSGFALKVKDIATDKDRVVLKPDWDALADDDWRPGQKELLGSMCQIGFERGIVNWATGVGKTEQISKICRLFPKAKICIVSRFIPTIQGIYERLGGVVGGLGIHCSGKKVFGRRVMCYTIGCLHHAHSRGPWDLLIADELHELATEPAVAELGKFRHTVMLGLSANFADRMDGADFELEGLFGRVLSEKTYEQARKEGSISPIEVHWRSCDFKKVNLQSISAGGIFKRRAGIYRNIERNELIAADAARFPAEQVLITVSTLEHALALKQLLPDFEMVYGGADLKRIEELKAMGLCDASFGPLHRDDAIRLRKAFESGKLRKVIATSVWNRAVNFIHLQVLIRGEGASNAISCTQIPGRLSRLSSGKRAGILIDYEDNFHDSTESDALRRAAVYTRHKWRQLHEANPGHFAARKNKRSKTGKSG